MACKKKDIDLQITNTSKKCPAGEKAGSASMEQGKIPVLSCEGACIRGEIARQAANMIAKEEAYGRGCHGELLTVPDSAIAKWFKVSDKVVLIDGCFLRCHGRILEKLLGAGKLVQFDALSVYKKYTDVFDADKVPEAERMVAARQVADHAIKTMNQDERSCCTTTQQDCCEDTPEQKGPCCG